MTIMGRDSWNLFCAEFDESVYCKRSGLVPPSTVLNLGDVVVCQVTTQRKLQALEGWQFKAFKVRRLDDKAGPVKLPMPVPVPIPKKRVRPQSRLVLKRVRSAPEGLIINLESGLRKVLKELVRAGKMPDEPIDKSRLPPSEDACVLALAEWKPDKAALNTLLAIQQKVGFAMTPAYPRSIGELYVLCQDDCKKLPEVMAPGVLKLLDSFFVPMSAAVDDASARPLASPGRIWKDATALRVDSWNHVEPLYTIYIDENWPPDCNHGILGGIIWRGARPDPARLPIPRQHLREASLIAKHLGHLKEAADCALPFIIEYTPQKGVGRIKAYERMVHDLLLALLGWVIPRPPVKDGEVACVQVICEAISDFPNAHSQTEIFQGILLQAGRFMPERYGCWGISSLVWRQKTEKPPEYFSAAEVESQGYLGMADLLCYLALEKTHEKARSLAAQLNLQTMKTWFRMNADTIHLLDQAERAISENEIGMLLDMLDTNRGSCVYDRLVENLSARASRDLDFVAVLMRVLDQRYLQKNADLRILDRQFALINLIAGELPSAAPHSLQLAALSASLKHSNHFGDPLADQELSDRYHQVRASALENGLVELVAHVDLNLAVRARDRFDTDGSCRLTGRLLETEARFSLRTRAKIYSSRGQEHSIRGQFVQAAAHFEQALDCFLEADLPDSVRLAEWDQTAIYRCVAAIDAGCPDRIARVESVLLKAGLGALPEAARQLASEAELKSQYHHYLLLRLLAETPSLQPVAARYLESMKTFDHAAHPWELIAFYQGMMLGPVEKEAARKCFDQALSICLQERHGVTLKAIAAMIATVAALLTDDDDLRSTALELIEGQPVSADCDCLEQQLPALAEGIRHWRDLLVDPPTTEGDYWSALRVLPFNYR